MGGGGGGGGGGYGGGMFRVRPRFLADGFWVTFGMVGMELFLLEASARGRLVHVGGYGSHGHDIFCRLR